ncbi:hypothetical protein FD755_022201 [Muntiacus reevesi]|uniref:Beta-defensin n=1 Tax=Muntiacus reevesi TaxID=9886 RepID=A0A5N3W283_MUNRE|nr:hypothetical protein FD755_022201 [Muntiacus reevesi]
MYYSTVFFLTHTYAIFNVQNVSRSELEPKYRFERCQEVKGICKPFCDDIEYDYGYCIKWRNQCCI